MTTTQRTRKEEELLAYAQRDIELNIQRYFDMHYPEITEGSYEVRHDKNAEDHEYSYQVWTTVDTLFSCIEKIFYFNTFGNYTDFNYVS